MKITDRTKVQDRIKMAVCHGREAILKKQSRLRKKNVQLRPRGPYPPFEKKNTSAP